MTDRRDFFKKVLALTMPTALFCACSKSTGTILLDRMHQLAQASTLTIELIRDTLEVDFVKDEAASHDMVTFFIGKPRLGSPFKDFIKLVDCRVPTKQNTALREPFLFVELHQAKEGLTASDLVARFGQPDSLQPSLPQDQSSSASYIYKVGSRSLWLSLSRQAPEQLMGISIHALEDAP